MNKGRKFYGCAKGMDDGCGFFVSSITTHGVLTDQEWAVDDKASALAGPSRVVPAKRSARAVSEHDQEISV